VKQINILQPKPSLYTVDNKHAKVYLLATSAFEMPFNRKHGLCWMKMPAQDWVRQTGMVF